MTTVSSIPSTHTLFLDKSPCCLEFYPRDHSVFVVGTYNLVDRTGGEAAASTKDGLADRSKKPQQRDGSLILCRIKRNQLIVEESVAESSGILDLHFSPHNCILAAATSTGTIITYQLNHSNDGRITIRRSAELKYFDEDIIITSFAWDPADRTKICVTLSTGTVVLLGLPSESVEAFDSPRVLDLRQLDHKVLHEHDLEAWITAFTPISWSPAGVFSGGDDAVLAFTGIDEMPSVSTNRRIHGAGVTSLLPLPSPPFPNGTLLTGSYDDQLRLLSIPAQPPSGPFRPTILAELNLGGGVWRNKIISVSAQKDGSSGKESRILSATLLVAGMYVGAFIVRLQYDVAHETWQLSELASFGEHESMCYGGDVQPTTMSSEFGNNDIITESKAEAYTAQVVTCSFYDKRLCLWRWQDDQYPSP